MPTRNQFSKIGYIGSEEFSVLEYPFTSYFILAVKTVSVVSGQGVWMARQPIQGYFNSRSLLTVNRAPTILIWGLLSWHLLPLVLAHLSDCYVPFHLSKFGIALSGRDQAESAFESFDCCRWASSQHSALDCRQISAKIDSAVAKATVMSPRAQATNSSSKCY